MPPSLGAHLGAHFLYTVRQSQQTRAFPPIIRTTPPPAASIHAGQRPIRRRYPTKDPTTNFPWQPLLSGAQSGWCQGPRSDRQQSSALAQGRKKAQTRRPSCLPCRSPPPSLRKCTDPTSDPSDGVEHRCASRPEPLADERHMLGSSRGLAPPGARGVKQSRQSRGRRPHPDAQYRHRYRSQNVPPRSWTNSPTVPGR